MPVYDEPCTPEWGERFIILDVLSRRGPLPLADLWKLVHSQQIDAHVKVFGDPGDVHGYSNFRGPWIKSHEAQGLIWLQEQTVTLTPLGSWLAKAGAEEFNDAVNLLDRWVCGECGDSADIALLTPDFNKSRVNRKGELWVAAECERCGYRTEQISLLSKMKDAEFAEYVNRAVQELAGYVKVTALTLATPTE